MFVFVISKEPPSTLKIRQVITRRPHLYDFSQTEIMASLWCADLHLQVCLCPTHPHREDVWSWKDKTFQLAVCLPSNPTLTPFFLPSPQAVGYKLAVLPVAGALLGSVLGGPLGLLAGFKAAGVAAALGGGALGFAGGSMVHKQRKAQLDLKMKQLTAPPQGEEESDKDKWLQFTPWP